MRSVSNKSITLAEQKAESVIRKVVKDGFKVRVDYTEKGEIHLTIFK
jgi:hypothetical protein